MKQLKLEGSPLNYTGGKHKLLSQIVPYIPHDVGRFVDLFVGGGSVTIGTSCPKYHINDTLPDLISWYREISVTDSDSFINRCIEVCSTIVDKETFVKQREVFNSTPCGSRCPYLFYALVVSCTSNLMRYNQRFEFNQTYGERTLNPALLAKLETFISIFKSKEISIACDCFSNFEPEQGDLVYLDPPYFGTQAGYNTYWNKGLEQQMFDILHRWDAQGVRFLLSGVSIHKGVTNPFMDRLLDYSLIELDYSYDKIAKKNKETTTTEMLVMNYVTEWADL